MINSAPILAIQLSCFSTQVGQLGKAKTLVSCTQSKPSQYLTAPTTTQEKVWFMNEYSLVARINHSNTLNRGHYWASVKDLHSSCWYTFNGKLVFNDEESSLNNATSYIYVFTEKFNFFPGSIQIWFCKRAL